MRYSCYSKGGTVKPLMSGLPDPIKRSPSSKFTISDFSDLLEADLSRAIKFVERMTVRKIAIIYNCCDKSIRTELKKRGYKTMGLVEARQFRETNKNNKQMDWELIAPWCEGRTIQEISEFLGSPINSVRTAASKGYFKYYGMGCQENKKRDTTKFYESVTDNIEYISKIKTIDEATEIIAAMAPPYLTITRASFYDFCKRHKISFDSPLKKELARVRAMESRKRQEALNNEADKG